MTALNRNLFLALADNNTLLVSIVYTRLDEKYCLSALLEKH